LPIALALQWCWGKYLFYGFGDRCVETSPKLKNLAALRLQYVFCYQKHRCKNPKLTAQKYFIFCLTFIVNQYNIDIEKTQKRKQIKMATTKIWFLILEIKARSAELERLRETIVRLQEEQKAMQYKLVAEIKAANIPINDVAFEVKHAGKTHICAISSDGRIRDEVKLIST
jgi:hypothetical protein